MLNIVHLIILICFMKVEPMLLHVLTKLFFCGLHSLAPRTHNDSFSWDLHIFF